MTANRTEILIYRAWKLRLVLGLTAIVLGVAGWELYQFGLRRAGGELEQVRADRARLQEQVAGLEVRNADLERRMALLERTRQIDAQAYAVFKEERSGLQDELKGLREELAFYRGILAPGSDKVGLQAQDFGVDTALGEGRYRYRFVLTQQGQQDQVARGAVNFFVDGLQNGRPKRLALADISESGDDKIAYRFRYFQTVEGYVQLPEGFRPERVTLEAVPSSAPRLPLEWTFDWPLEAGGVAEEDA